MVLPEQLTFPIGAYYLHLSGSALRAHLRSGGFRANKTARYDMVEASGCTVYVVELQVPKHCRKSNFEEFCNSSSKILKSELDQAFCICIWQLQCCSLLVGSSACFCRSCTVQARVRGLPASQARRSWFTIASLRQDAPARLPLRLFRVVILRHRHWERQPQTIPSQTVF